MKNIFKKRTQKPALVLINPEAWNMLDTYEAIEAYRVKQFEDGHKEVSYYTRNLWYQFKMGLIVGGHTAMSDMTLRPFDMDGALTEARLKAGVRG